ncbi:MAG: hypothetical protein V4805_21010 [Pseudomonadota bacterium]
MNDALQYPQIEAMKSVLTKLGIDPSSRYDNKDQDFEYSTCKPAELERYIELYVREDTSAFEKRVLGCYFLACLNHYIQENDGEHPAQQIAFNLLNKDIQIHQTELEYWASKFK